TSDEQWLGELSGVTVPDVTLRVVDPSATMTATKRRRPGSLPPGVLMERRGSLLFTHFGLSGPAALDVSRAVTGATKPRELRIVADFLPTIDREELEARLQRNAASDGKKLVATLLSEELPRRLLDALVSRAGIIADRRAAEFSKAERAALVDQLKQCEIS